MQEGQLGKGNFGLVRLGYNLLTNEPVAVKCSSKKQQSTFEYQVLTSLQHPNIIRPLELHEDEQQIYMVMELIEGGDLMKLLEKKRRLSEREAFIIFHQIAEAVDYCHRHGVVHRDLKLENILLTSRGEPKLIDFGVSMSSSRKSSHSASSISSYCSLPYASPEVLRGYEETIGAKSDVWSLGVILFCLLTGRFPFSGPNVYDKILSGSFAFPSSHALALSLEVKDLISKMLLPEASERASIQEVLKHPWMQMAAVMEVGSAGSKL
eukprot:TRINITY_DN4119_c0_g1_i1.p1 TRINITY_DN4119_c0_g1~~TRINITY_DN4119_c0_g1_i1.p1  ORF type:complete len:266 (-),score=51.39 TRINITY_DN4119_c0_g1_i1:201-998(-)